MLQTEVALPHSLCRSHVPGWLAPSRAAQHLVEESVNELFVILVLPAVVALMAVTFVFAMSGVQEVQSVPDGQTQESNH